MTYRGRVASSKTWNNPLSTIVSKGSPSVSSRQRVEHLEAGLDAALSALAASDLDRARGDVDAEGVGAAAGRKDRVLAGPAAGVQECAGQRAGVRETDKGGLWAAYVPGRRRTCIGVVPVVGGVGCGDVGILSRWAGTGACTGSVVAQLTTDFNPFSQLAAFPFLWLVTPTRSGREASRSRGYRART